MNHGTESVPLVWPEQEYDRVPYRLYTDRKLFDVEMQRIFGEKSWSYAGLSCELAEPGAYKTTMIGDRSVVVCRNRDGKLRSFVNRCAHRGVKFCRHTHGHTQRFICPYHQWTYTLDGDLKGVPFIKGIKGQGGMPDDFKLENHGLQKLAVTEHNGVVFVSFSAEIENFVNYLGDTNLSYFERVFDGRELRVLGYARQLIPGNWKLLFENIKDPYHATLLHVFLVTFGLFRADQQAEVKMDPYGRHGLLISSKGEQRHSSQTSDMENLREDFKLKDPRLLDPVREYDGNATVVMQTIWPNLIVQQQSNTIAMRQIQPRDPGSTELSWTFFGYADDDDEMVTRRLRQANLMSCSGLVSGDDSEVIKMAQDGLSRYPKEHAVYEMGGRGTEDANHMVTETAIRAFYKHYRAVMDI